MAPFGKIYSYPNNPRVAKAQAAANINGLELEVPEYKMGETNRTPEFLAKFPFGKVPAFEGADGTTIVESDAIAQYVAESGPAADQLLGATPAQRALIRQWITFADGETIAPVIQLVVPRLGIRPFDEATEKSALEKLERSLGYMEKHLAGRTWLVTADKISLADITLASALQWGFVFAIDAEMRAKYPNVMAWYKRTIETEGVKQAFGEQKYVEKRETPKA
ncbi:glutathione S-transferase [Aspergillus floccosus]